MNTEPTTEELKALIEDLKRQLALALDAAVNRPQQMEANRALSALRMLHDAADVYAADQSQAKDERIGLVQPITAEDGSNLNEALVVAAKILEDTNHRP